jgi:hypothetical protein
MMMMIRCGARRNDHRHRFERATTTIGALHTDEAMGDGKEDNDASSSSSKMMMMMTDQKAFVDDVVTRAADAARASAERYDFASAFVGSMLCATWFVMRGQSVETALMIVFCATITAVVAEELLQDVERDGGGR